MLRGGVQGQSCKQGGLSGPPSCATAQPWLHVQFLALERVQQASWLQGLFKYLWRRLWKGLAPGLSLAVSWGVDGVSDPKACQL